MRMGRVDRPACLELQLEDVEPFWTDLCWQRRGRTAAEHDLV